MSGNYRISGHKLTRNDAILPKPKEARETGSDVTDAHTLPNRSIAMDLYDRAGC
jgi:hypothetical protein